MTKKNMCNNNIILGTGRILSLKPSPLATCHRRRQRDYRERVQLFMDMCRCHQIFTRKYRMKQSRIEV